VGRVPPVRVLSDDVELFGGVALEVPCSSSAMTKAMGATIMATPLIIR